jgi:hypothetical protein
MHRTNERTNMQTDGKRAPLQIDISTSPPYTALTAMLTSPLGPVNVNLGLRLPISLAQPQRSAFRISYSVQGHLTIVHHSQGILV